jgi:hypothetical protein
MNYFEAIFTNFAYFQLAALLAGALFFAMTGIRALKDEHVHGFVYFLLSTFFFIVHGYLLFNLPPDNALLNGLNVQQWLFGIFAPVLVLLFVGLGIYNLLSANGTIALIKILLGLSLLGLLYMVGQSWSMDFRGIVLLVWSLAWFKLELKTA